MTISPADGSVCPKNGNSPEVVIVEDNQEVLSLLRDFFEASGHPVRTFLDSEEALRFFSGQSKAALGSNQVVICDLTMPKVTGLQLTEAIKKLSVKTPVILMTAYGDRTACEKSKEAGAYAFLPKPFSLSKIKTLVDEALIPLSV